MSTPVRVGLCTAVLLVGLVQVSVAFSRSLIPYRIDGTLHRVGVVADSHQRLRTVTIGDRTYEVDNPGLAELRIGRHITKEPWTATLLLDRRKPFRLAIGDEVFRFVVLTALAVVATWLLTGSTPSASDPEGAVDGGRNAEGIARD